MLLRNLIVLTSLAVSAGFFSRTDRTEFPGDPAILNTGSLIKDVPTKVVPELHFSDSVEILVPGLFHGEDVFKGAEDRTWFGIYSTGEGCTIRRTEVGFGHAFDPVLDAYGEKSAWRISEQNEDGNAVFLLSGVVLPKGLDEAELLSCIHKLPDGPAYPVMLVPGTSVSIGESCRIDIHGNGTEQYRVEFLDTEHPERDMLVAGSEWMDDAYMYLLWAGDLNADGLPDLLLNTSHKYIFSNLELFLSDKKNNGRLRSVAIFRFTSC